MKTIHIHVAGDVLCGAPGPPEIASPRHVCTYDYDTIWTTESHVSTLSQVLAAMRQPDAEFCGDCLEQMQERRR